MKSDGTKNHVDYMYPKQMEEWLDYAFENQPKPSSNSRSSRYITYDKSIHKMYCAWREMIRERDYRCYVLYTDARFEFINLLDYIKISLHIDLQSQDEEMNEEIKQQIFDNKEEE